MSREQFGCQESFVRCFWKPKTGRSARCGARFKCSLKGISSAARGGYSVNSWGEN